MIRRSVYFSGRVQGVGFRYTTCEVASRFAVSGFVRNLPDGRVEAVVEGEDAEVESFVRAVREEMRGYIRDVCEQACDATGEFAGFQVRR